MSANENSSDQIMSSDSSHSDSESEAKPLIRIPKTKVRDSS